MRIGIFLDDTSVRGRVPVLTDYLATDEARQRGILAVPLFSLEDLNTHPVDCVQLLGVSKSTCRIAEELSARKIPYVVYSQGGGISNAQVVRFVKAGGKLFGNMLPDHLRNIPYASRIFSRSSKIMVPSQRQASFIENGFSVPKENIAVVYPVLDERFFHTDPRSFKQQLGIDHCIFSVAGDFRPVTNALQLLRALGKINLPSIVLGKFSGTTYAEACKQVADEHQHIQIIDDEDGSNRLCFSALAACDVFVDPSPAGMWSSLAVNAAVLGKKVVVSNRSGLQEYFGGGVEFFEPTSWELMHHGMVMALNNGVNVSLRSFLKEECSLSRVLDIVQSCYRSALPS